MADPRNSTLDKDSGQSERAPQQGMESAGGSSGVAPNSSTTDYGMGSGNSSDQKEGSVGKLFDKLKDEFYKEKEHEKERHR